MWIDERFGVTEIWAHVLFRSWFGCNRLDKCFWKSKMHLITFVKLGLKIIFAKSHLAKYNLAQYSLFFFPLTQKGVLGLLLSLVSTHQSIAEICHDFLFRLGVLNKWFRKSNIYLIIWGLVRRSPVPNLVKIGQTLRPVKKVFLIKSIMVATSIRLTWKVSAMFQPWDLGIARHNNIFLSKPITSC